MSTSFRLTSPQAFPVDILDSDNFRWWEDEVKRQLRQRELWDIIQGEKRGNGSTSLGTGRSIAEVLGVCPEIIYKKNRSACKLLLRSVTPNILRLVPDYDKCNARATFNHLCTLRPMDRAWVADAWLRFDHLKWNKGPRLTFTEALQELVDAILQIQTGLRSIGYGVPSWIFNAKLITILTDQFPQLPGDDITAQLDALEKDDAMCPSLREIQQHYLGLYHKVEECQRKKRMEWRKAKRQRYRDNKRIRQAQRSGERYDYHPAKRDQDHTLASKGKGIADQNIDDYSAHQWLDNVDVLSLRDYDANEDMSSSPLKWKSPAQLSSVLPGMSLVQNNADSNSFPIPANIPSSSGVTQGDPISVDDLELPTMASQKEIMIDSNVQAFSLNGYWDD